MKKQFLFSVLILTFFSFQSKAQLSGTYTIGPSGNHTSFTAAVSALTTSGISGPVVFNITPGTYNEQITIPSITGSSSTNTITFQSANGDSSSVILNYSPTSTTNNFTVKINAGTYITFNKITIKSSGSSFASVIEMSGTNISLTNNIIIGKQNGGLSSNYLEGIVAGGINIVIINIFVCFSILFFVFFSYYIYYC